MLASVHLPPANTVPYLSFSCHYLLGAYKQRRFFLSNHCEKAKPYLPLPSQNKPEISLKTRKMNLTRLLCESQNDSPIWEVSKLLSVFGLRKKKKKTLKKLLEASCQQIKRRLEMISAPFVDVWSHGYLQDN